MDSSEVDLFQDLETGADLALAGATSPAANQEPPRKRRKKGTGPRPEESKACFCTWRECSEIARRIQKYAPEEDVWRGPTVQLVNNRDSIKVQALRCSFIHHIQFGEELQAKNTYALARHHWPRSLLQFGAKRTKSTTAGKSISLGQRTKLITRREALKIDAAETHLKKRLSDDSNRILHLLEHANMPVADEVKEKLQNHYVQAPIVDLESAWTFACQLEPTFALDRPPPLPPSVQPIAFPYPSFEQISAWLVSQFYHDVKALSSNDSARVDEEMQVFFDSHPVRRCLRDLDFCIGSAQEGQPRDIELLHNRFYLLHCDTSGFSPRCTYFAWRKRPRSVWQVLKNQHRCYPCLKLAEYRASQQKKKEDRAAFTAAHQYTTNYTGGF